MCARKADLAAGHGVVAMDIFQARSLGAVPKSDMSQPQSLVQRIRARKKADRESQQKQSKRQRRREFDENLKAARARGEKV